MSRGKVFALRAESGTGFYHVFAMHSVMNQSGKVIRVAEHTGEGYFVQGGLQRISLTHI